MSATNQPTGVDLDALLARIHGNTAAMGQLVDLMLSHLPGRLDAVDAAVAAGDANALSTSAHSLKGSLSNFTQGRSWELASALESNARRGELEGADALASELRSAVGAVVEELQAWSERAP